VLRLPRLDRAGLLLSRDVDAMIVREEEATALSGFTRVALVQAANPHAVPPQLRLARPVPIVATQLSATSGSGSLAALLDGRLETTWSTAGPQQPGDRIELRFAIPTRVARVELALGPRPGEQAGALQVRASIDAVSWSPIVAVPGRVPPERQSLPPRSQVLVFEPLTLRGLQVVQAGRRRKPWSVAELRVFAPAS
jgi:hypothetical protein